MENTVFGLEEQNTPNHGLKELGKILPATKEPLYLIAEEISGPAKHVVYITMICVAGVA